MKVIGNEEQVKAITHFNGPCMVIAPPGSGKTFTIIQRIQYLLKEKNVSPNEILVITFTKAAAEEMKERFLRECEGNFSSVTFGTFHAIYFHIIKQAYPYQFQNIITPMEKREVIKTTAEEYLRDMELTEELLGFLLEEIGKVKNAGGEITDYHSVTVEDSLFVRIFEKYQEEIRYRKKLDFEDMMLICYQLLKEKAEVLEKWQQQYRYILIDEFQDINALQYEVIKLLAGKEANLFVVGDDDQSIYGFRGANPQIMLEFKNTYQNAEQILLKMNYRSTATIVEAAKRIIKQNKKRFEKEMKAEKGEGEKIICHGFDSIEEEVENMITFIQSYGKSNPLKKTLFSDIAVIYRTNANALYLIERFIQEKIPFLTREKFTSFYKHFAVVDMLAYLQFVFAERKRSLFFKIMNKPKRYISRSAIADSLVDFKKLKEYYEGNHSMVKRIKELEYQIQLLSQMTLYAAINYIRKGMGYDTYLRELSIERKTDVSEYEKILDALQTRAKEMDTIEEWLYQIQRYEEELENQKAGKKKTEGVTVITMHSSKGLEYPIVMLPDINEGTVPHKKAQSEEELEEERRLFYVAATRAKERLFLFYIKKNHNISKEISRFILEITSE